MGWTGETEGLMAVIYIYFLVKGVWGILPKVLTKLLAKLPMAS
jgi:hypothetical protein